METISIFNLKGGVGKTFTAINMAYELHRRGFKVLLLDNDKQGNLSAAYKKYNAEEVAPAAKLLSTEKQTGQIIQKTEYHRIDIITANMSLLTATLNLVRKNIIEDAEAAVMCYRHYLDQVKHEYDYCIIDNPPDIAMNVVNALMATDEVIIPVKVDDWALNGLDMLEEQIEDVKAYGQNIRIRGILITAYQKTAGEEAGKEWLEKQIIEKRRTGQPYYPILGAIRWSKKVAENTFMHNAIYEYSPCCAAAQDYKKFVTRYTGKAR